MPHPTTLIVGAGAIGGLFAGYLAAAGRSVTLLARGDNARAIAQEGIRLTTPTGDTLHGRPRVVTTAAEAGVHDIVLYTTKAFSLPEVIASTRAAIGPATLVSPVVNGIPWWFGTPDQPVRAVDPDGALVRAFGPEQLVGGTTFSPTQRTSATTWHHVLPGQVTFGPAIDGGDTTAAQRVASIFEGTAFGSNVKPDLHRAVWTKLVNNATFNTLCALTGTRQIDVARDPDLGPLAQSIMREIEALAAAHGKPIETPVDTLFRNVHERGVHRPSMLQDFDTGRPIELAAIVDAAIELAERRNVPMPELRRVGAMVRLKAREVGLLP